MNPTTTPNILNPRVQAVVAIFLLLMFAGALFLPALLPSFKPEPSVLQTLLTLVVVGVTFYLGTSSGSSRKDDQIAATTATLLSTPPLLPPTAPPTSDHPIEIDSSTPVNVKVVPTAAPPRVTPSFPPRA